jgi:hypothetical protein
MYFYFKNQNKNLYLTKIFNFAVFPFEQNTGKLNRILFSRHDILYIEF